MIYNCFACTKCVETYILVFFMNKYIIIIITPVFILTYLYTHVVSELLNATVQGCGERRTNGGAFIMRADNARNVGNSRRDRLGENIGGQAKNRAWYCRTGMSREGYWTND